MCLTVFSLRLSLVHLLSASISSVPAVLHYLLPMANFAKTLGQFEDLV